MDNTATWGEGETGDNLVRIGDMQINVGRSEPILLLMRKLVPEIKNVAVITTQQEINFETALVRQDKHAFSKYVACYNAVMISYARVDELRRTPKWQDFMNDCLSLAVYSNVLFGKELPIEKWDYAKPRD